MKPCLLLAFVCLLCFFFSCQNSNDQKEYYTPLSDSTSVTRLTGDSVKLVKTAGINFKVKNVEQSTRAVSGLAQKYGGMLTYQNMESPDERRTDLKLSMDSLLVITAATPHAAITARIPSQNLEDFLFAVADLGYYTGSSRLQIDDKSLQYLENVLKQKNRSETLAQAPTNKKTSLAVPEIIAVKDEAIAQQMLNRSIDADVAYSTINLNLFQNPIVRRETIANSNVDDYRLSFWKRFGNAVAEGWEVFLSFIVALAHLWMFILLGAIALFGYKNWIQKRKPVL